MRNVRSCFTYIPTHLPHDPNMFVTVQQRVFILFPALSAAGDFYSLETGVAQHDYQPWRVFVRRRNGIALLSHHFW